MDVTGRQIDDLLAQAELLSPPERNLKISVLSTKRIPRVALPAAILVGFLVLAAAPKASAAIYAVDVCTKIGPHTDVSFFEDPGTSGLLISDFCTSPTGGALDVGPNSPNNPISGGKGWRLSAPDGVTIKSLTAIRTGVSSWDPGIVWELRADSTVLESFSATPIPGGAVSYSNLNAQSVVGHLFCTNSPCLHSAQSFLRLSEIRATVEDENPPTASVDFQAGATVSGTIQIPYHADDEGGGLKSAALQLDGVPIGSLTDSNGGKCAEPFRAMAPCKAQLKSSASLDTTRLSDGPHRLIASAMDAAGQNGLSTVVTIDVRNSRPPQASGAPETKIVKHPRKKTVMRKAKFTFTSDQPSSGFQCKVDKGRFKPCRSPFIQKVKRGRHIFKVRALNSDGALDPTPAIFRWKVA
jgi:hypothetical protein